MKSTVEQIRARFDNDVERFSNLETGQAAVVDSPLCMELVASAAAAVTTQATDILDIGCGAGNYTLKLIEKLRAARGNPAAPITLNCTLLDLSRPMLDRAVARVTPHTAGHVRPIQADMREVPLTENSLNIVVAASTLHHLRTDQEWRAVFAKIFRALRPGGSFWIFDLVEHSHPAIESVMRKRYGEYLESLKGGGEAGRAYREHVFAYIAEEDTPKSLLYQLDLLRTVGFRDLDILHKNVMGAAFGGVK
jgi:tRNA (cmo5U34)-methyltransferase